jgi:hypothetical protein
MPYIKEDRRQSLDTCIENMISCLSHQDNEDMSNVLGDINYCFSRVLSGVMKQPSYNKIAMITGVLENIKQEFYRRVASPYEDKKILENGDIKEYKKL